MEVHLSTGFQFQKLIKTSPPTPHMRAKIREGGNPNPMKPLRIGGGGGGSSPVPTPLLVGHPDVRAKKVARELISR
jgi:hypothetical protein